MIPELRRRFNAAWTPARYRAFLDLVERRSGEPCPFRLSETPVFLPRELVERTARAGRELVEQLLAQPEYRRAAGEAIPERWRVPDEAPEPLFTQADFGLIRDAAGQWQPRLVEIQGFPSLYAFQPLLAECYRDAYAIDPELPYLPGIGIEEYRAQLGQAIVGGHDPRQVVLLEIDPSHQKTRGDFRETERLFGIRTVDIRSVYPRGSRLYFRDNGQEVGIKRIYNRAIADELERREVELQFDFSEPYQVEWAGHPNWYFLLSKFSLPWLRHDTVPWSRTLADLPEMPADLSRYVLKPLYSFAGLGVVVGPTREQIDSIPAERRADYLLQERMDFAPSIDTPHGPTKIEIRVMYIGARPVNVIIRSGRGAQMGVDHNKNLEWVGASAAFFA